MPPVTRTPPADALAHEPAVVLDQVTHGFVLLDDAVVALADAGRIADLALLVARRIDLPADAVARALDAASSGPAMLMCRAAGLGANSFSAVLRLRRRRLRAGGPNPAQALSGFLQTPVDLAQEVVGMMKADARR
jgi:hypothetical protein